MSEVLAGSPENEGFVAIDDEPSGKDRTTEEHLRDRGHSQGEPLDNLVMRDPQSQRDDRAIDQQATKRANCRDLVDRPLYRDQRSRCIRKREADERRARSLDVFNRERVKRARSHGLCIEVADQRDIVIWEIDVLLRTGSQLAGKAPLVPHINSVPREHKRSPRGWRESSRKCPLSAGHRCARFAVSRA